MKLRKRKGISLVEVMMAFVLIGFLVLLVGGAVVSSYKTAVAMRQLPGLYYRGMQEIEDELDRLEETVTKKYLLEKELATLAVPDPALTAELEEIDAGLEGDHEKVTVRLFGRDVAVYRFQKECEVADVGTFTLAAGTASGVRMERPVPVIEKIAVAALGEAKSAVLSAPVGKTLSSEVTYSDTNRQYVYTELYQWYVSTDGTHTVWYSDGEDGTGTPGPDEMQHGRLMPVYPGSFTLLTSERSATLTVRDEYRGKFLFCLVTPLSVNGKMGASVMSSPIYVSDLPDGVNYRAVIDPSLVTLPYDPSGESAISTLNSVGGASGSFLRSAGTPKIDLNGADISGEGNAASRFIHFESSSSLKSGSGFTPQKNDAFYAVVRLNDPADPDFFGDGSRQYNFNNCTVLAGPDPGGWMLVKQTVATTNSRGTYTLGAGRYDLAVLIVAANPGQAQDAAVTGYLKNKYGF